MTPLDDSLLEVARAGYEEGFKAAMKYMGEYPMEQTDVDAMKSLASLMDRNTRIRLAERARRLQETSIGPSDA